MAVVVVAVAAGIGVVLVLLGLMGRRVLGTPAEPTVRSSSSHGLLAGRSERVAIASIAALVGGLLVLWITRWPVAALTAAGLGAWSPMLAARRGRHDEELAKVDAIAVWTEQLRDTISAANGLEHAIVATAQLAPQALGPSVGRLAARVEFQQFDVGLRDFAVEVDHPLADFVVAALVTAGGNQAREVAALLGHLASCARGEAAMRRRVWVGRARSRSAVRIIVVTVVVFMAALLALDDAYLAPYGTPMGQLVLVGVIGLFGGSIVAMDRMGRLMVPERFIARRIGGPA